jgi:hypothetical protein
MIFTKKTFSTMPYRIITFNLMTLSTTVNQVLLTVVK